MSFIVFFILFKGVIQVFVILLLIVLILVLWSLRKRVVTVPSISLSLEKAQYEHGETVNVSGAVNSDYDVPAKGATVKLRLTDSAEVMFEVGTAVTDEEGKYSTSFTVPSESAPGGATVTATCEELGVTATASFTRSDKKGVRV